ncbi:hypothetical protein [Glutamicibacter uratoxydans]|uniref:hypothetical protein n=1 Tax=Glutamicibacter uratoxydans TaxID=43667 RepID=UPI003D6DC79C
MTPLLVSIAIGTLGSILLHLTFRMLKSDWPTSYSDMKTVVDSASQRNAWLYVAMRFVPVYVVSVLVASMTNSAEANPFIALTVCAVLHICRTNLRPSVLRRVFRSSRNRPRYLAAFFSSITFIVLATFLASKTWSYWESLLPEPDQLVQAIWTSLFVGLVVVLVRSIGTFENNLDAQIKRALDDLGKSLQKKIREEALANKVSADFIEAIVLTECIQRPKWVRRAEYIKGRFIAPGSYGVAQVSSSSPISDEMSIELICKKYAGYYPVQNEYGSYNQTLLRVALESHNPDPIFVDQAKEILEARRSDIVESSSIWAEDGRKLIEVTHLRREGQEWVIVLTHSPDIDGLCMTTFARDGGEEESCIDRDIQEGTRSQNEIRLSIQVRKVEFKGVDTKNSTQELDSLTLDLEDPHID